MAIHQDLALVIEGSPPGTQIEGYQRKASGGPLSDLGRRCRDTFLSLKKTCGKLGLSFWQYLKDRLAGTAKIAPLPDLMRQVAAVNYQQLDACSFVHSPLNATQTRGC